MKKCHLLLSFVFVVISGCCYSQQNDTTIYLINGVYYTQSELDSMQARLIELENIVGDKKYSIRNNSYKTPFQNAAYDLSNSGDLLIAGEILTVGGICITGIGFVTSEKYFYLASAGCAIASLICFVISGVNIKNASKEFQKISVENGKIVIKIE